MAPGVVDSAFVTRMRQEDPFRAARLFDAEFAEDVNVSVLSYSKSGGKPRLSEVFDLTASHDPSDHGAGWTVKAAVPDEADLMVPADAEMPP